MAELNPMDLANWLIANPTIEDNGVIRPTNQKDAKVALKWTSKNVTKIKSGNLANNRANLVISWDNTRNANNNRRTEYQKLTTPDAKTRSQANRYIKIEGGNGKQVDHVLTNNRLALGVKHIAAKLGITEAEANMRMATAYAKAGMGYGHSKANLNVLTSKQNNLKEVQEKGLDKLYRQNENRPSPRDPNYAKLLMKWLKERKDIKAQIESNGTNGTNGTNGDKTKSNGDKTKSNGNKIKSNGKKYNGKVTIRNGGFKYQGTGSSEFIMTDVDMDSNYTLSDFIYRGSDKVAGFGTV